MLSNFKELHQYRALLFSLTLRELRARYRASVLGFLWTFLNPTLNMVVYAVMFGMVIKQNVPAYPYFLFVGQLPWINFASSVMGGATSISDRRDLLTKVRFPAQVLPATVVATNLCNYLLSLPLLFGLGLYYGYVPTWHLVFLVPVLAVQTLFTLAVTYLLAAFNVAFRDLQHIVGNVLTMAFFLTPVLWPISALSNLSEGQRNLVLYGNPMASLVGAYRDIFYLHRVPEVQALAIVTCISLVLMMISAAVFEARREEFAELI